MSYKGVTYHKQTRKWRSNVGNYNCGQFDTEIEAVKARDKKIMNLGLKYELQIFRKL
jgi:hypothetical protein